MNTTPIQPGTAETEADAPARKPLGLDWLLLLAVAGLSVCSVYTIWAATRDEVPTEPYFYVWRQCLYIGVGFVLMFVVSRIDYSRFRDLKYGIYATLIGLIVLVLAVGASTRGPRLALQLPFFSFQPSELGKLLLILALSAFVVDRIRRVNERDTVARAMLMALFPAMLVIAQPDLGTGLVYIAIVIGVLFVAGVSWKHFAALGGLGVAAVLAVLVVAPAAGMEVLEPYQVKRLTGFINPSSDPGDATYQINQSLVAIGSGQKTGRGTDDATQTRLAFLPERHTDFIFSVIGEQFGFLGAAIVLSLYALLIWRGLRILTLAKNLYGALIAGGITVMLLFQLAVNVGMTIGVMPITGIPLLLVSYGGSSVLMTFLAIGVLQSIHAQAVWSSAGKRPIGLRP